MQNAQYRPWRGTHALDNFLAGLGVGCSGVLVLGAGIWATWWPFSFLLI